MSLHTADFFLLNDYLFLDLCSLPSLTILEPVDCSLVHGINTGMQSLLPTMQMQEDKWELIKHLKMGEWS